MSGSRHRTTSSHSNSIPLPPLDLSAISPFKSPSSTYSSPNPLEFFTSWRGRQMRAVGPLLWPCDSLELERVEAQHWLLRLLLGSPFLGPMGDVLRRAGRNARILDIATGVGVWAMDVAEMFPWAEVVGAEDAPIQDRDAWDNVEWEVVDLEDLPYESSSFNVVHIRFAQLRVKSFSHLLKSAWRLVRPGGLLLIFDAASPPILSDGTTPTGAQAWSDAFHKSLRKAGLKFGFVDEVVRTFKNEDLQGSDMQVPIGHGEGRMGQLGKIHVVNTRAYLEASRHVMIQHGEYTDAEVDVLTEAYLANVKTYPMYTRYHAFSVRKPP